MSVQNPVTGEKALDFTYNTAFETGLTLSETVKKANRTFLVFLRYYGCRSCQLDLREFNEMYPQFQAKDAQILVVLQSTTETMREQSTPTDPSYAIICDPDMALYQLYNIRAAESKEAMASELGKERVAQAAALGIVHGAYEGDELQLPATFLLDQEMNILYHKRAEFSCDIPHGEEMLAMV